MFLKMCLIEFTTTNGEIIRQIYEADLKIGSRSLGPLNIQAKTKHTLYPSHKIGLIASPIVTYCKATNIQGTKYFNNKYKCHHLHAEYL